MKKKVLIVDFNKHMKDASQYFQVEWMEREDSDTSALYVWLYWKTERRLHVQEAMVQQLQTTRWVLDLKDEDIFWCTADPGWVTGTAYGIFGPMLAGATSLILGGRFSADTWYGAIEEYGVTVWYSAPTAFRMLMGVGEGPLRILIFPHCAIFFPWVNRLIRK